MKQLTVRLNDQRGIDGIRYVDGQVLTGPYLSNKLSSLIDHVIGNKCSITIRPDGDNATASISKVRFGQK